MDVKKLDIDVAWMRDLMVRLLRIPSPTGRTDEVMQAVGEELEALGLPFELTRRGAMLATAPGASEGPARAVIVHTDTIGCMVRGLKENGRLAIVPVGTHSARFAEGSRVTIFTDDPAVEFTGTILPLKASGHAYDTEVDTQGVGWDHVEVRVDAAARSAQELRDLGMAVGDFVALNALPEVTSSGYVKSRHLDDKAGVAAVLAAFKALLEHDVALPVRTHLFVTITEEVGHGASHGLDTDVAEMVSIDSAVVSPEHTSTETGVTVVMQDLHGPFDYHLSRKLLHLARDHGIEHHRDIFRYYRSDIASALEAGAETRAALLGFGVDATHGFERTHLDSIRQTAELVALFLQTDLTFRSWDAEPKGPLKEFPSSSVQPARTTPQISNDAPEPEEA